MKAVISAIGLGTQLSEETTIKPTSAFVAYHENLFCLWHK